MCETRAGNGSWRLTCGSRSAKKRLILFPKKNHNLAPMEVDFPYPFVFTKRSPRRDRAVWGLVFLGKNEWLGLFWAAGTGS
ncbi:MAG: hypothetical protein D6714_02265 [Bacteroidetes bacterium]|nr:MAG: hypothetical protein D6714_02265 [Bacteroidota bacterium]